MNNGILITAAWWALTVGSSQSSIFSRQIFQPAPMPRTIVWKQSSPPEEVQVTTADGLVLRGYRWKARCKDHSAMVFFHGNGGNRHTAAELAEPLRRDDVDLIVASYRGYGDNPGQPTENGLYQDAAAFIQQAQASAPERLYLFGFSLGGAVAVDAASRFKLDGLVTLGTFSTLRSVAPRFVRALLPYEFDNLAKANRVGSPWLLMHGTGDKVVSIAEAEKLKAAAGEGATLVRLTGAPHNVALDQVATRIWSELGKMTDSARLTQAATCTGT